MHTKIKGDIGELIVAHQLLKKGWKVAFPYGENSKYDLIAEKDGVMRRVQVKAVFPRGGVLRINCRSFNNWTVIYYNARDFEVLAAVDLQTEKVYYIPSGELGRNLINIRIDPTKNCQKKGVNSAEKYLIF